MLEVEEDRSTIPMLSLVALRGSLGYASQSPLPPALSANELAIDLYLYDFIVNILCFAFFD